MSGAKLISVNDKVIPATEVLLKVIIFAVEKATGKVYACGVVVSFS